MAGGQLDLFGDGLGDLDDLPPDCADDDPLVKLPVVHRLVPAAGRPLPTDSRVSSVFAEGSARALAASAAAERERRKAEGATRPEKPLYRVSRAEGVTRCERILPQETDEWAEREAARRARQKPPKPVKGAKTRGAKLLEMIGGGNG